MLIIIVLISDKVKVPSNKIADIIKYYELLLLSNYDNNSSKQLIKELIAHYIEIPFNEVILNLDLRISESQLLDIHFGVKRLLKNEPIQYIFGETDFLDIKLKINTDTLIPRPETEELVLLVQRSLKNRVKENIKLLDIGTGSGCIAIAIQKMLSADVTAIDISDKALDIAIQNAKNNNSEVNFKKIDILDKSQWNRLAKYDIIISNPPYVQNSEKELMQSNVLDYEPSSALFVPNNNPLIFYKAIAEFSKNHLNNNGEIWLEINEYLAEETKSLFKESFAKTDIIKDFRDKLRFCKIQ